MVKQKPFKRKRYKKVFPQFKLLSHLPFKTLLGWIFALATVFVFIYFIIYIFRSTLFKSEYYIYDLRYSSDSVEIFDDPVLYKIIKDQAKGENYYVLKHFKKTKILHALQDKFPFVLDLEFSYSQKNTLDVRVVFDEVDLRFLLVDKAFVLYKWQTFLLYSWNNLWRTKKMVELPYYLSGLDNLNWLFFGYPYEKFVSDIEIILQVFGPNVGIVYIVWAKRIAVFVTKEKIVYINLNKDIKMQMTQYDFLRSNDPDFKKYYEIDLGSLEWNMVIVRK
jgi:hypothetical protein